MATVASPPSHPGRQQQGTQKRLFRSISRFLSGNKNRPKLNDARTTSSSSHRAEGAEAAAGEGVPLGEVRSSTRSTSTGDTASTSMQDDDDDRDSISRLSGLSGADTDASLRPISPSSVGPASSIVSRTDSTSNASFAPTHGTFKSYASTKPTTLSLDSGGGANRIAVVPGTGHPSAAPLHHSGGHSHLLPTSSSGGSLGAQPHTPSSLSGAPITFSALPSSTTSTPLGSPSTPTTPAAADNLALETTQVPRHTLAHPRNNPYPAAPPADNASMLTLASSSFAPSFSLSRASGGGGGGGAPTSAASGSGSWGGGGLTGLRAWRKGDEGGADEDASVRVLAGSRRASDESLGGKSTWSAAIGRSFATGGVVKEGGAPSVRTVGTTGTGGDLLSQGDADSHLEPEGTNRRESMQGGETEAQRVVRKEGEKEGDSDVTGELSNPLATPTNLTPTTELDSTNSSPFLPSDEVTSSNPPIADPSTPSMSSSPMNNEPTLIPPPIPSTSESADAEPIEEGSQTPKRGTRPVERSLSIASGTETDAQSFADARSEVDSVERA
ncbi:hypothetical protein BCR35DRAFT_355443 [Leucosporidium creatinivorum]|uniref:Uncharacterized protein n=1 Tax=Leucosporidium creatinivorum TaxID=106004 RepID=A0A1Y2DFF9_9BASI|nr:hypothetical protein BCR35DRAFT_355443 [Leucosporidium creatinivorum]